MEKPPYLDAYFEAVAGLGRHIRETQRRAIEAAAEAVAESLANKGAWAVMDTGHLLQHEARFRAGGLLAITPFQYGLTLDEDVLHRKAAESTPEALVRSERCLLESAFAQSRLQSGDVLLINSNSGRTVNVIEAARTGRSHGLKIIGVASKAQMEGCAPAHPEGLKLFDVCDIAIDNGAPFGDAAIGKGDGASMCPLSGLAAAWILWAIQAEAVAQLESRGVQPSVYQSVHTVGEEAVDALRRRFSQEGI